jgi:hypothetical protein
MPSDTAKDCKQEFDWSSESGYKMLPAGPEVELGQGFGALCIEESWPGAEPTDADDLDIFRLKCNATVYSTMQTLDQLKNAICTLANYE